MDVVIFTPYTPCLSPPGTVKRGEREGKERGERKVGDKEERES